MKREINQNLCRCPFLTTIGSFFFDLFCTGRFAFLFGLIALLPCSAPADQAFASTNIVSETTDEFPSAIEITVPNSNRKVYKGLETDECLFVYTNLQGITCTLDLDLRTPDLLPIAIPKQLIYRMPPAIAHKWPNGVCNVYTNLDDMLADIDRAIKLKGSLALCRPSPIWPGGKDDDTNSPRALLLKHMVTNCPALVNWDEVAKANATVVYKWEVLEKSAESKEGDLEENDRWGNCEIVDEPFLKEREETNRNETKDSERQKPPMR